MTAITVKHNQRVAYVGKTGSGKTYLAKLVTSPVPRLMVLDGKDTLQHWDLEEGSNVVRKLKAGYPGRLRVHVVRPADWIPWLQLAWDLGNIVVYIDEMILVNPRPTPTFELARLYQTGRERGIGVQASTQRPRNVPAVMFSEADWFFLFRVSRPEDRKAVADFGDENGLMRRPIYDKHGFWTYSPEWRKPRYTPIYRKERRIPGPDAHVRVGDFSQSGQIEKVS